MQRHIIIGKGKVGAHLKMALENKGHEVFVLSRSTGFHYPVNHSVSDIHAIQPDYVWVAAGYGSVLDCSRDYLNALKTHVGLPVELAQHLKEKIGLILFSTDYVADELLPNDPQAITNSPRSLYAMSKIAMESSVRFIGRPNTVIFRIGNPVCDPFSVLGKQTIAGKILLNNENNEKVYLPANLITPTDLFWLSNLLTEKIDGLMQKRTIVHHASPLGNISVYEYGKLLLDRHFPRDREYICTGFDRQRPFVSDLECSFARAPRWDEAV